MCDMPRISVLLIHRYRILVDTLRESLNGCPDLDLHDVSGGPTEAVAGLARRPADVILFDVRTASDPTRATMELRRAAPKAKILPFGLSSQEEIVRLLEAGACGYVAQDAGLEDLRQTIRQAHSNQAPSSPLVVAEVVKRLRELSSHSSRDSGEIPILTARELKVLELVSQDLSNREIGKRMGITVATVKMHVHNLFSKLKVEKRRDAVRVAAESGILEESVDGLELLSL